MFTSFLSMGASDAIDEATVAEYAKELTLIECTDDPLDACMRIAYESTANFNNITKALAMDELKYFQENGVEYVYETADGKGNKIVNIFKSFLENVKRAWEKFMGVIKKFITDIDSFPAYAWYKANKKKIDALDTSKGVVLKKPIKYDYTRLEKDVYGTSAMAREIATDAIKAATNTDSEVFMDYQAAKDYVEKVHKKESEATDIIKKVASKESKQKIMFTVYKNIMKEVNSNFAQDQYSTYSFEDFSKDAINLFREEKERTEISADMLKKCIKNIADAKDAKSKAKTAYDTASKNLASQLKKLNANIKVAENDAKSKENDPNANAAVGLMYTGQSILTSCNSVISAVMRANLSAIRSNVYQSQHIVQSALLGGSKEGQIAKDTLASVQHNSATMSFLDSLELI